MSDLLPPDLPRLRVIETYLNMMLQLVRDAINDAERREREQQRGAEHRPPAPDWVLEMGIGTERLPVYVHVGTCHMVGKRARGVSQDIAVRALTEGVEACSHCRPETLLGVLD
jgi:hypothetical protein